jgi:deferrochelatase/peroxidase EfeB
MDAVTSRRAFLRGTAGAGAGLAVTGALSGAATGGSANGGSANGGSANGGSANGGEAGGGTVAFHGARQAGIVTPAQPQATVLACDVLAADSAGLRDLLQTITDRARALTVGGTPPDTGIAAPPIDSGVLGPDLPSDRLTITVGVGSSLFDGRFGLAAKRPAGLTPMPVFEDDHLDPAQTHGDLSVQICADNRDAVGHAVRDIAKATRGGLAVRWRVDGFKSPPRPSGTPRNLLGFKDGTSNLPTTDGQLIWVPDGWAANGSYQVIRKIRMLVEFWDRISVEEQENLVGRRRDSGAPMDGNAETDAPRFSADPTGAATPLTSHIRLANPRTPESAASRILRRPYNFDNGMDLVGNLDMGLLFIAYQANTQAQFEAVQRRLAGEPLVDYIEPVGGGYFLALPGVRDASDYLGRPMFG